MTNQKAVEYFKEYLEFCQKAGISQEYYEVQALAIKALGKQVPMKPVKVDDSGIRYTDTYRCPSCGGAFTGTGIANYCYHCGQALDWEKEDG